jgi:predicted ribonuclease YlaK
MEVCGPTRHSFYVLDTNVLIHDPNALLNFEEHHVIIPMTVLEELDKLKSGKTSIAADCRQAIRLIDQTLADAPPDQVEQGVPIQRGKLGPHGTLAILMDKAPIPAHCLPNDLNDNLEALHMDDECTHGSVDYILDRVPLQFKSLNYIRGRSFQQSFILIDESQNLTPHQIKTIITRAGAGSKVVCLGNLAQIDTPYLNATSSGLTYLTECFKDFPHGVHIHLQGVPRSVLAEYAETHL